VHHRHLRLERRPALAVDDDPGRAALTRRRHHVTSPGATEEDGTIRGGGEPEFVHAMAVRVLVRELADEPTREVLVERQPHEARFTAPHVRRARSTTGGL
jgi:hypothetical protein